MEHYRRAIAQAVKPGDTVVDLGCGFAPLGLMALRAGAGQVWGIDSTDAIEIARETVRRAGWSDRYHCLHALSFQAELPQQADVILCDHVGYFGIDYGIAPMLQDARQRMLKPGGTIIPQRLSLELAGVESPACRARADEWAAPDVPEEFRWLKDHGANTKRPVSLATTDLCTDPATLLTVDLAGEIADNLHANVELEAVRDCQLDGLGGWFGCTLVPGITMTNSPLDSGRIARDQAFFPFAEPLTLQAGDRIAVTMNLRHDANIYGWSARNLRTGERRRQSTLHSTILSAADLVPPGGSVALGALGKAAQTVAAYIDGSRSTLEIEEAVARDHPDLMPTPSALRSFVRSELVRLGR